MLANFGTYFVNKKINMTNCDEEMQELNMKPSISLIHADNFTREVIDENRPLLLLCMAVDDNYKRQLDIIKKMSLTYKGLLKIGLLEEAFLAVFKKIYKVVGTPTFLLLMEGKERSRFLGLADEKSLVDFITTSSILIKRVAPKKPVENGNLYSKNHYENRI